MSPPQSAVDIVKILRLIRRIDTPLHLLSIMSHRKDVVSEKIVVRSFLSVSSLNFLLANKSPDWQVVCPSTCSKSTKIEMASQNIIP